MSLLSEVSPSTYVTSPICSASARGRMSASSNFSSCESLRARRCSSIRRCLIATPFLYRSAETSLRASRKAALKDEHGRCEECDRHSKGHRDLPVDHERLLVRFQRDLIDYQHTMPRCVSRHVLRKERHDRPRQKHIGTNLSRLRLLVPRYRPATPVFAGSASHWHLYKNSSKILMGDHGRHEPDIPTASPAPISPNRDCQMYSVSRRM